MQIVKTKSLELRFLQTNEGTAGSLDMFEMILQPNGRMPVPHHHESWDETIYGLTGTTAWIVGRETTDLGPGQSLFIKRGVVHGFANTTDRPSACLCVLTPGVLGPAYFQAMADLLADGAPDLAAMKALMLRHGLVPAPPEPSA